MGRAVRPALPNSIQIHSFIHSYGRRIVLVFLPNFGRKKGTAQKNKKIKFGSDGTGCAPSAAKFYSNSFIHSFIWAANSTGILAKN